MGHLCEYVRIRAPVSKSYTPGTACLGDIILNFGLHLGGDNDGSPWVGIEQAVRPAPTTLAFLHTLGLALVPVGTGGPCKSGLDGGGRDQDREDSCNTSHRSQTFSRKKEEKTVES